MHFSDLKMHPGAFYDHLRGKPRGSVKKLKSGVFGITTRAEWQIITTSDISVDSDISMI